MITALVILIITMLDTLFFQWWLDPFLEFLQKVTIYLEGTNTWWSVILDTFRILNYFIPVGHQIALFTVVIALIIIKSIFALYHAIAQIIP